MRSGSSVAALAAGALLAAACAEPVAVGTEVRHPTFTDVFTFLAREAPPGSYPKYLLGRQTYWTIVGAPDDEKEALVNEEGLIEVDDGSFSLEPFLFANGGLVTWADAELSQSLAEGFLPIPTVAWRTPGLVLEITAFAAGEAGASTLHASYRIENIRWTQYFTRDGQAIHENFWRDPALFGIPSSHGCLGMRADDAFWFWQWADQGIPISVHD